MLYLKCEGCGEVFDEELPLGSVKYHQDYHEDADAFHAGWMIVTEDEAH